MVALRSTPRPNLLLDNPDLYSVLELYFLHNCKELQNAFMNDCFFIYCKIRNQNNKKVYLFSLFRGLIFDSRIKGCKTINKCFSFTFHNDLFCFLLQNIVIIFLYRTENCRDNFLRNHRAKIQSLCTFARKKPH